MEVAWKPDQSAARQPTEPCHCQLVEPKRAAASMRVVQASCKAIKGLCWDASISESILLVNLLIRAGKNRDNFPNA